MAIRIDKIREDLIRVDQMDNTEDNFGLGVFIDASGVVSHSGLIICYDEEINFFHFTGDVELDDVAKFSPDLYFKKLDIFPDDYFAYIKAYFDLLIGTINPHYGFVFSDSFYDEAGEYISDLDKLPDFATCVGFCINVIRGLLYNNSKYLEIGDWDEKTLNEVDDFYINYVTSYLQKIGLESGDISTIKNKTFRRISPAELTASGFYKVLPIRKVPIATILFDVNKILREKWVASESDD